jgi:hypothetical protein
MTTKVTYDLSKLVTYDLTLPSRYWLKGVRVVGWAAAFSPVFYVALLVWETFLMGVGRLDPLAVPDHTIPGVVICCVLLFTSFVLTNWSVATYGKHYERVRQGYVVCRETHDDAPTLEWCVKVYGYTRANQLREDHCIVEPDEWCKYEVGELADFR